MTKPESLGPVPETWERSPAAALRAYAEASAMVAASTFAGLLVAPRWGTGPVDLLYLPPVLAAGTLFGLGPSLFAAVASALAYNFFFTSPVHTFRIESAADLVTVAVLFLVAVVTSQLSARMRAQARIARAQAARHATIAGFARRLLTCAGIEEIGTVASTELAHLFACNVVLAVADGDEVRIVATQPPGAPLTPSDLTAAAWVLNSGQPAGRGAGGAFPAEWLFHPVRAEAEVLGGMGLARDDGAAPVADEHLPLLGSLLDQVALALARAGLEAEIREVAELRQRDRLRNALLSSVGHDLRTPLTTIAAAAADLRGGGEKDLALTIEGEAAKLERYIANLLDMARVEAGVLRPRCEAVDLVDSIGAAMRDLRQSLADRPIAIDVPPSVPLVLADARLLHHCLINLLDNAARYAPPGSSIAISATCRDGAVSLAVEDGGPGFSDNGDGLFDVFTRAGGSDRKGGAGLGLAIVKAFAEAMGLAVEAANRPGGGARLSIIFPAAAVVPQQEEARVREGA